MQALLRAKVQPEPYLPYSLQLAEWGLREHPREMAVRSESVDGLLASLSDALLPHPNAENEPKALAELVADLLPEVDPDHPDHAASCVVEALSGILVARNP